MGEDCVTCSEVLAREDLESKAGFLKALEACADLKLNYYTFSRYVRLLEPIAEAIK